MVDRSCNAVRVDTSDSLSTIDIRFSYAIEGLLKIGTSLFCIRTNCRRLFKIRVYIINKKIDHCFVEVPHLERP